MSESKQTSEPDYSDFTNLWQQGTDMVLEGQKQAAALFQEGMETFTKAGAASAANSSSSDPLQAWQQFMQAWSPAFDVGQAASAFQSANPFLNPSALHTMLDPANWTGNMPEQMRRVLSSIAAAPRFADLQTPHIEAADAWRETLDYQQALGDMGKVIQGAWGKAYEEFARANSLEELQPGNMQGALDAWLSAANNSLLEAQRSPEFLDAQKRMVRAATEIRARQRDLAETWSSNWQMPTRTEVDDLSRSVHELRREVRALKHRLSKYESKGDE